MPTKMPMSSSSLMMLDSRMGSVMLCITTTLYILVSIALELFAVLALDGAGVDELALG